MRREVYFETDFSAEQEVWLEALCMYGGAGSSSHASTNATGGKLFWVYQPNGNSWLSSTVLVNLFGKNPLGFAGSLPDFWELCAEERMAVSERRVGERVWLMQWSWVQTSIAALLSTSLLLLPSTLSADTLSWPIWVRKSAHLCSSLFSSVHPSQFVFCLYSSLLPSLPSRNFRVPLCFLYFSEFISFSTSISLFSHFKGRIRLACMLNPTILNPEMTPGYF